ncbi:MAG: peptidase MA family metallohydrolase [Chloroflexi bacterium]|nr:peptidase MA family metallohydrolase [Chloroflexota bacterium]MDA1217940.1 peptidase MA family metallohydrolase [Chloroflexota bacterium]
MLIKLTLLIAVILTLLSQGSIALAQGDGAIRVVSESKQVNFPDELTFAATIEGDQEISQVRLNYRIADSRVWSYSNTEFLSAKQVTVKFSDLLGGSVYLPPGTRLDYYYSIRDVAGNTLNTSTESFIYADNRFNWQEVQVGALTLHYHDLPSAQAARIAGDLTGPLEALAEILELQDVQTIQGFIYNSHQEATPAFPKISQTTTQQHVFQGFAFAEAGVFLGVGLQPSLIVHESAHLMLAQSLEPRGRSIPSWLNEGFASYVEPGSRPYSGQSLSGQGLPLSAMSAVSGTPQDIEYFYHKAESVVAYLLEEHGSQSFQLFLSGLRQGSSVDEALLSTYGFDTVGLDTNWADSEVGRSATAPGRFSPSTPFLLFNSWFLGVLILLVMAAVLVRYIYRKLRPADDDYFDWDDSPPD